MRDMPMVRMRAAARNDVGDDIDLASVMKISHSREDRRGINIAHEGTR